MSVTHSVAELIEAVGTTYKAIDIRAVGLREADSWANVMAVVRLTYEDVDTARARITKLVRRYPRVQTELLHIEAGVRPFAEWNAFCSEIRDEGILRVGEREFHLREHHDLNEARSFLQWGYSEMRPFDGRDWPALRIKFHKGGLSPLMEERCSKEVHLLGYEHAFEAVNALCELNVSAGHDQGCELSVYVPVFANISSIRIKTPEKSVCVEIERHRAFSNMSALVCMRGLAMLASEPFREQSTITDFPSETKDEITLAKGSAQFEELGVDDWVQIRLMHPKVGVVKKNENHVRMYIPPAERKILLEALKLFCGDAKLEDLLTRAYDIKAPRLNESAGFELRVAWLLGMFGLSTIVLGDYEQIVATNTKVRRATVDILAASQHGKLLLAVACTLNPPKAEDFANLRYAREILTREVFVETAVRVIPVLFTSSMGCPSYDKPEDSFDAVPIVDADQLKILLRLLRAGQEETFFQFLANPVFNELHDVSEY